MLPYLLCACTLPHITNFFFFTGLICMFLVFIVLSESCSLRKRGFPSVSGTVEVGLYVKTNRQIWQGWSGQKGVQQATDLYGYFIRGPVLITHEYIACCNLSEKK